MHSLRRKQISWLCWQTQQMNWVRGGGDDGSDADWDIAGPLGQTHSERDTAILGTSTGASTEYSSQISVHERVLHEQPSVCERCLKLWWYICSILYKSRFSLTLSRYYVNWKCSFLLRQRVGDFWVSLSMCLWVLYEQYDVSRAVTKNEQGK